MSFKREFTVGGRLGGERKAPRAGGDGPPPGGQPDAACAPALAAIAVGALLSRPIRGPSVSSETQEG